MSEPGRLLGVDHGKVRVGLAVSDPERRLASPLQTYTRRSKEQDAGFFRTLAAEEKIVQIVVGLPAHLDGREGEQARLARAFGKWLGELTGLPFVFFDESFTTHDAEQHLLAQTLSLDQTPKHDVVKHLEADRGVATGCLIRFAPQ